MDRLFSKFNLGDIKVNERSSFPPDAEPTAETDQTTDEVQQVAPAQPRQQPVATPAADAVTTWAQTPQESDVVIATATATANANELHDDGVAQGPRRAYRPGYGQGATETRGEILKVSSRSRPSAVAGAIAGVVRENGRAEVQAIGAGAANQAIKAVAIARDYLHETGIEAICLPSLVDLTIDDADRTAIRLVVESR